MRQYHMHMYLNSVDNTFHTKMSEARTAARGVNTSNASLNPSYEKPAKTNGYIYLCGEASIRITSVFIRFTCMYVIVHVHM